MKVKKEKTISEFISDLYYDENSLIDNIVYELGTEQLIKLKKKKGIPLTEDEQFFDNYFLSPTFKYNMFLNILRRKK